MISAVFFCLSHSVSPSFSFLPPPLCSSFLCFTVFWYQGNSSIMKCIWISPTSSLVRSLGFPRGSACKESACNAGDLGFFPGLGRSPGEENGYPLQYSGLENPMDYSPWGCKEWNMTEQLSWPLPVLGRDCVELVLKFSCGIILVRRFLSWELVNFEFLSLNKYKRT